MTPTGEKPTLTVIETAATDIIPRPLPPGELSPEEAEEWISLVNAMEPSYWPRVTHPTLVQLVRHIVVARHIAQLIERSSPSRKLAEWRRLLAAQRAETLAITNLLRSMRLTHLSIKPSSRTPLPDDATPKPWLT